MSASAVADVTRGPTTFWAAVEHRAAATPESVLVADERGRRLTATGYRAAAEAVAAWLHGEGVGAGSVVAWQFGTNVEAVVLMAALARLGAVQVPIVPILRRKEVGFILGQTGAGWFVVPGVVRGFDHAALAHEIDAALRCRPLVCDGEPAGPHALSLPVGDAASLGPSPKDLAPDGAPPVRWIYYTSGTTAEPKGARHTDASVLAASNGLCAVGGVGPDDVFGSPVPFAHVAGAMLLGCSLRTGARQVLLDGFDPVATPAQCAAHDVTIAAAVGPMYPAFLAAQRERGASPLLPRLRYCVNGGAAVPVSLHRQVRDELGGAGVLSSWGLTESPALTFPPLDTDDERMAWTVGRPAPGVDVRAVRADGRGCDPDEEGELVVRGPQRMLGYVDASLDETGFDADGYVRTGDLGRVDADGYVTITGRLKDVIIRSGENISAREVEEVLLTHPKVADVAVIGVRDERTGERCCAVVALASGADRLTLPEVAEHCQGRGMARQKTPERLELVDTIPRNDLGKVQKQQLKARFDA
jgi:acyl-CoA synthetase (AMP-forming)/AMP-acid ligase II